MHQLTVTSVLKF